MSEVARFINIKAVQDGKELIPFWDSRIQFHSGKNKYGLDEDSIDYITIGLEYSQQKYINCVYDIKEHKVILGIEKEYLCELNTLPFIIGQPVLYEIESNTYELTTIKDIIFETFTLENQLGKDIENYNHHTFFNKDEEIDKNAVYSLKTWTPTYVLSNGTKVDYVYKLKKLKQAII